MYNEIEREFNTEVKQKKSIARGAYSRKCGSKSKKCSLPSDNLTAAQKRRLNGPVLSYAINQPMSWDAFKAMPTDLQQAHIDYIQNRFEIGVAAIERHELGVGPTTLRNHLKTRGIQFRRFQGKSRAEDFIAWVAGECARPETEPEQAEVSELSTETVSPDQVMPTESEAIDEESAGKAGRFADLRDLPGLFCGGKLCMSGKASEIIPSLLTLIGGNEAWLSVHLSFTGKDD